jgi:hypothetical protein
MIDKCKLLHSSYQESNRSGPFSSLTTRSRSYASWLLIKRGGLAPIAIQRAHLGNRASIILVQERKAVEVPGDLDTVAADLEALAETQSDAGSVISRKLWLIVQEGTQHLYIHLLLLKIVFKKWCRIL